MAGRDKPPDMRAAASPQGRSVDLNTDQYSRLALMFANVREDLGGDLRIRRRRPPLGGHHQEGGRDEYQGVV